MILIQIRSALTWKLLLQERAMRRWSRRRLLCS